MRKKHSTAQRTLTVERFTRSHFWRYTFKNNQGTVFVRTITESQIYSASECLTLARICAELFSQMKWDSLQVLLGFNPDPFGQIESLRFEPQQPRRNPEFLSYGLLGSHNPGFPYTELRDYGNQMPVVAVVPCEDLPTFGGEGFALKVNKPSEFARIEGERN